MFIPIKSLCPKKVICKNWDVIKVSLSLVVEQLMTMLLHFFRIGQFLFFSDNLGYSLLKNVSYPNLWPPCGGIWSNSIVLSFMGKYSSLKLVFFSPMTYIFWTAYVNYLKFATTIKVKGKFDLYLSIPPMTYIFWDAYVNYLKFATTFKVKGKFERQNSSAKIAKNNAWVNKPYFLDEKSYANSLLILK